MYTYYKIFDSISKKYLIGNQLKFNEFGSLFYSKEIAEEWLVYLTKKLNKSNKTLDLSIVEFVSEEQFIIFDFDLCVKKILTYVEGEIDNGNYYNFNTTLFVYKTLSDYIIEEQQGLINSCKIYIPYNKMSTYDFYFSTIPGSCACKAVEYYNLTIQKDV